MANYSENAGLNHDLPPTPVFSLQAPGASQHKPYWRGSSSPSGCVFCFGSTLARLLPCLFHCGSTSRHSASAHPSLLPLECLFHSTQPCFKGIFQITVGMTFRDRLKRRFLDVSIRWQTSNPPLELFLLCWTFCEHLASTGWSNYI